MQGETVVKGVTYRFIVANTGLALAAVLCIVSTFLPWLSSGGSGMNSYDSYFSGTPEALLIASGVILAAIALNTFRHNKLTRVLNGLIGIIAAIVIAGTSLIVYSNDKGGMNSINSYSMSSLNISTSGLVSIGLGNYLALGAAGLILVFSILALAWGKYGKKKGLRVEQQGAGAL